MEEKPRKMDFNDAINTSQYTSSRDADSLTSVT